MSAGGPAGSNGLDGDATVIAVQVVRILRFNGCDTDIVDRLVDGRCITKRLLECS
ncbi:MAG: hypothetical protein HYY24_20115 [Verrucomicrobia bacterium]|nr:hypothetical protein [Verrucomicrobiota bacterium]